MKTMCCKIQPVLFFLLVACWLPAFGELRAGTAFTYQGRLNDGSMPATGSYDLRFALCDAEVNGPGGPVRTNLATPILNGVFRVLLDFGDVFQGEERWLEIGVRTNGGNAFTTLSPRQRLTPTPYAIHALHAASVAATNVSGVLASAQLPTNVAWLSSSPRFSGTVTAAGFAGNGAGLTNVPAASLVGLSNILDWINVKHPPFNAKGDGVADDTAALQNALTAIATHPSGLRNLYIPPGRYKITSTLDFPVVPPVSGTVFFPKDGRVRVFGAGYGSTILQFNSTTLPAINMVDGEQSGHGAILSRLSIMGPNIGKWKSAQSGCVGIHVGNEPNFFAAQSFELSELAISGFYTGITFSNAWQPLIERCLLSSNYMSGMDFSQTHFFSIKSCEIDGVPKGREIGYGVRIFPNSAGVEGYMESTSISYATNGIYNRGVTLTCVNVQLQDCGYYINLPYEGCLHWIGGGISELMNITGGWDLTNGFPGAIFIDSRSASTLVLDSPHFEWVSPRPLFDERPYDEDSTYKVPTIRTENSLNLVQCLWNETVLVNVPIQGATDQQVVNGQLVVKDAPYNGGAPATVITGPVAIGYDGRLRTPYGGTDNRWHNTAGGSHSKQGAIFGPRVNGTAWDVPVLGWYDYGYGIYSVGLGDANNAVNSVQWINFKTGPQGSAGTLRWRIYADGTLTNASSGKLDLGRGTLAVPSGIITNGGVVWVVTNNVPSLAYPRGSLCTRTDTGRFYVKQFGGWVEK